MSLAEYVLLWIEAVELAGDSEDWDDDNGDGSLSMYLELLDFKRCV